MRDELKRARQVMFDMTSIRHLEKRIRSYRRHVYLCFRSFYDTLQRANNWSRAHEIRLFLWLHARCEQLIMCARKTKLRLGAEVMFFISAQRYVFFAWHEREIKTENVRNWRLTYHTPHKEKLISSLFLTEICELQKKLLHQVFTRHLKFYSINTYAIKK